MKRKLFTLLSPVRWYKTTWRLYRTPLTGHCPHCRYDLTGNTSGACPECGAEVQSRKVQTSIF